MFQFTICIYPPVAHCANASHADVPDTMRRRGCESIISNPPQSVTGCNLPRDRKSHTASAIMKRSVIPKYAIGPSELTIGHLAIAAVIRLSVASTIQRL